MKINELIGIKKHSDRDFDPRDRSGLTGWLFPKSITDVMKKAGWKVLGNGVNASVFGKKGKNYVIKIYRHDSPYEIYLKYALEHQENIHVPKIGKVFTPFKERNIHLVQMEKLQELPSSITNNGLVDGINIQYIFKTIYEYIAMWGDADQETIKSIYSGKILDPNDEKGSKKQYEIKEILTYLINRRTKKPNISFSFFNMLFSLADYAIKSGVSSRLIDMHSGNIMLRNGVYVITDPFSGRDFKLDSIAVHVRNSQPLNSD